eukprot:1685865-Amphidinium_carterae.1
MIQETLLLAVRGFVLETEGYLEAIGTASRGTHSIGWTQTCLHSEKWCRAAQLGSPPQGHTPECRGVLRGRL